MEQTFLKEKFSQIDELICKKDKSKALDLIDDILEWAPYSSEAYWKKLLAEAGCKNDYELLKSGYMLLGNPAFENAKKYANESEKKACKSIKKAKDSMEKLLEAELEKKELEDKSKISAKEKLIEYKKKAGDLQNLAQKNINRLEETERLIHECAIDCSVVFGECQYALENIRSEAQKIGDNCKTEISKKEKDVLEAQLDIIENECSIELNELEQQKVSNSKFLEYSRLIKEQEAICNEISQNKADLENLYFETTQFANSIDGITKKYASAKDDIYNGWYSALMKLLSQARFEEIAKQVMSQIKSGGN